MKRHLLNISNHPSSRWEEGQKRGWDTITDVPFPQIDPSWDTTHEGWVGACRTIGQAIEEALAQKGEDNLLFLFLAGEFSVCHHIIQTLVHKGLDDEIFLVVPTTRREVVETVKEDGTVEKRAVFKFVKWRVLP